MIPTVLFAAASFAIAYACRAPLWLAVLSGACVAAVVWRRTP